LYRLCQLSFTQVSQVYKAKEGDDLDAKSTKEAAEIIEHMTEDQGGPDARPDPLHEATWGGNPDETARLTLNGAETEVTTGAPSARALVSGEEFSHPLSNTEESDFFRRRMQRYLRDFERDPIPSISTGPIGDDFVGLPPLTTSTYAFANVCI